MARAYVATIQILLHPHEVNSGESACDAISELLNNNACILDWGYPRIGGHRLLPCETFIPNVEEYEEGKFLE